MLGCNLCTNGTLCAVCQSGYYRINNVCKSDCPTNNSLASTTEVNKCQDLFPYLYLDKISLWSVNGSSNGQLPAGYNFSITWRYVLLGVHQTAISVYNFETGAHKTLSYVAQLVNVTTTNGAIAINPSSVDGGLVFMTFSIIITTHDVPYIQVVTFTQSIQATRGTHYLYLYANSTKFNFTGTNNIPYAFKFLSWIAGVDYNTTATESY